MTDAIVFTPTFKHTPWVDTRDRVSASGPNGFNIRFDTLQKDLESLSGVVKTIDTAIKLTGQHVAVERRLSVAPAFAPVAGDPNWELDTNGVAVRPATAVSARGIVAVAPPDRVKLMKFRALGTNTGSGTLNILLVRSPIAQVATQQILSRVVGTGTYDVSENIQAGMEEVDMEGYRYSVKASLVSASTSDTVTIASVQISYILG
ncbi:hypothetical protein ACIGW7_36575 [Streptomyces sp. NPDC053253]|uniref:hypothetical protein n=1 Tax=Streptomyces sp. NPDC053253 TaxID=3365699 RepID=UPI0037D65F29